MASKQEQRGTQEKQGKPVRRRARAMGAMRNAFRNFVECPDPLDGSVDEGTRTVNRCEAAAVLVADLSAADAVRILALAAASIEADREDGDGCLSMLVGEAVRLQVMGDVWNMADPGRTPCGDGEYGGYGGFDGFDRVEGFDGNGEDGGDIPF